MYLMQRDFPKSLEALKIKGKEALFSTSSLVSPAGFEPTTF